MTAVAQAFSTDALVRGAARLVGLALLSGVLGVALGLVYRWYAHHRVPEGFAVLVGLGSVAVYLNTTTALSQVMGGSVALLDLESALFNVTAFVAAAGIASAGSRAGDRLATDVFAVGADDIGDVARVVRSVGRGVTVTLPENVEDMEGYDPVPDETKAKLAGEEFHFPRRLTVAQLRERLVDRLTADYGVGHVDVDLTETGEVEYLALGSRLAGIGATLPPEQAAVAVRADPAFAASAGDRVQVWRPTAEGPERVAAAEVRATAGDTVTLVVDAGDVADPVRRTDADAAADTDAGSGPDAAGTGGGAPEGVVPGGEYRLVTLPVEPRHDRAFASLFVNAAETLGAVTVEAGSDLAGLSVGALDAAVVAVSPADDGVEALPSRSRAIAPGETVYVMARPDALRRLEAAASGADAGTAAGAEVGTGAEATDD